MDTEAMTQQAAGAASMWSTLVGWWQGTAAAGRWLEDHLVWLTVASVLLWLVVELVRRRLGERAISRRVHLRLTPSRRFSPELEHILRFGWQATRAAGAGPWWAPRMARTVRIRLRADGHSALEYHVEGPAQAKHLLAITPYGRQVSVEPTHPRRDLPRTHVVRAQFTLHGHPGAQLREVPLDPDPLQPLLDALADMQSELGDVAEVCLDLSPAPRWRVAAYRWRVLAGARAKAREQARRDARQLAQDAALLEDSLTYQLARLGQNGSGAAHRRMLLPPLPRVDRTKALGKLVEDNTLVRIQLLVRCASNRAGRAERRLRQLEAALDVFGARARFAHSALRIGPLLLGPNWGPLRRDFDRRFATGLIRPGRTDWASIDELAGLLKPPTAAAHVPVSPAEMPRYRLGAKDLLPQGFYRGPDGRDHLLATWEAETYFETASGKSRWGKTERALVQAVAVALGGRGLAFVDPHRDTWDRALPFLAHPEIAERLWLVDMTARGRHPRLPSWNPLDMRGRPAQHEVVAAVLDAIATTLGWDDSSHPRATTILTKAVEALCAVNAAAVAAERPDAQATLMQIRPLLTSAAFRGLVLDRLEDSAARWWATTFDQLPDDAMTPVLNPLDRLAANPVTRAFLGSPTGGYNIRTAMDTSRVVWICTPGSGPTDRLVVALLVRDLLRTGLARRAVHPTRRRPFRVYLDELITLDGAAATSLAEITEQLGKFGVRLHGMTQLLHRLSGPVRAALIQNASTLSTTAGSIDAIRPITAEWGDRVDPGEVAELDRFCHWASFTVGGRRIGPLPIRGPELTEVYGPLRQPTRAVAEAEKQAHRNVHAQTLHQLTRAAGVQEAVVADFLNPGRPVRLAKGGPHGHDGKGSTIQ